MEGHQDAVGRHPDVGLQVAVAEAHAGLERRHRVLQVLDGTTAVRHREGERPVEEGVTRSGHPFTLVGPLDPGRNEPVGDCGTGGVTARPVRACHRALSAAAASVRPVAATQHTLADLGVSMTRGPGSRASRCRSEPRSGAPSLRLVPPGTAQAGSVGRPRLYCGQACRQRAYEQRSATAKAGLPGDVVLVTRAELDGLQDRLYQLRCALEDVQTLLTERPTKAELERSLADLLRSTGRLDRLWITERRLS